MEEKFPGKKESLVRYGFKETKDTAALADFESRYSNSHYVWNMPKSQLLIAIGIYFRTKYAYINVKDYEIDGPGVDKTEIDEILDNFYKIACDRLNKFHGVSLEYTELQQAIFSPKEPNGEPEIPVDSSAIH